MKISIAMCTYNGAKFLSKQLESFVNQITMPNELIICDDSSTDDTIAILKAFSLTAPFQVSIHQNTTQLGVVKNFEKAIGLCTGDLIFLADQDDLWAQEKVKFMYSFFVENPKCQLLFTDAVLIDEFDRALPTSSLWTQIEFSPNMQSKLKHPEYAFWHYIKGNNYTTGAASAFRSSLLKNALPFPKVKNNDWYHDWWLSLNAANKKGLFFTPEKLTKYRIHRNQQVGIGEGAAMQNQNFNILKYKYTYARKYSFGMLYRLKMNIPKKCFYVLGLIINLISRSKAFYSQTNSKTKP
jgi:glycosyltransferase involved in cell wall biosynthesis